MATQLRSGSNTAENSQFLRSLQDPLPDPEPVRLVTRMHVGSSRARPAAWRIIADLLDGHRVLVSMGMTPAEARQVARARARELPKTAVALRLQRWVRTATGGRWNDEA